MIDSIDWSVRRLAFARARLAAAEMESRRFHRALHDGVQQDLIAVAVRLQLARGLTASDAPAALALLEEMGRDVREALHRVQALAEEIYPGVLDMRGLPDALSTVAAAAGVLVNVEAMDFGRYAADVELAVYFCGLASLKNIAAHAGVGARATIRLHESGGAIQLEVADDGAGFDTAALSASGGLAEARDRVEAVDGRMSVRSQLGRGTCVEATVPLYEAPAR